MEKIKNCPSFKDGCPYDKGDTVHGDLKDCPAFKEGCPFHKNAAGEATEDAGHGCPALQGHECPYLKDGGKEMNQKVGDCPEFKEKCPFDTGKVTEKLEGCPVFKGGCPYAEGKTPEGTINDCPAFKGHHCPYDHKHVRTEGVAESHRCPVIHPIGCPYLEQGPEEVKRELDACPKFLKDGHCPYATPEEMEKLKGCPVFKDGCPFQAGERVDMSKWKNCPAFVDGCPYNENYHAFELKGKAKHLLAAILKGTGKFDGIFDEKFVAVIKGSPFAKFTNTELDQAAFIDFSTILSSKATWEYTLSNVVAEGHTVILNAKLSGQTKPKESTGASQDLFTGVRETQLTDITLVSIIHFDTDAQVERFEAIFDLSALAKQMGLALVV